jgi:hypothetical protein
MYEHRLAAMIAVTSARTYHARSLPVGFFLDPGQIDRDYADERRRATRRLRRQAAQGIITFEEADAEGRIADEVMAQLSMFFDYRSEESDDAS